MGNRHGVVKICTRCKERKKISEFYKSTLYGRQSWCKRCQARDRQKDKLMYHYGLSLEEYYFLHDEQLGTCAICHNKCKSGRRLAVDHNHETGKTRGLLCMSCNRGLGLFNDDRYLLAKAVEYLEEHLFEMEE